ncbi:hypothetical protein LTR46_006595 [Exophiala xenobiotica]|nr:hypothetical protein LTR46_006595 [Exophiala xenobiotica]
MALNFGGSDIIAGIRIALAIYEITCVQDNRADFRLRNFAKEIQDFGKLLEKLKTSLNDAATRYDNGVLVSQKGAHDPRSDDFEKERRQMVGNFEETLEECQEFLEDHERLLSRSSNIVDNITWHVTSQDQKIAALRHRIHMHATKIKLVIDRLSINLLTNLDAKVDDLLDISQRNIALSSDIQSELREFYAHWLGVLAGHVPPSSLGSQDRHHASEIIQARFEQAATVSAAASNDGEMSLGKGFDALLTHFEQSAEGKEQTPENYLSLLKTRWLLGRIKASQGFRVACPGYYYKRAVSQVEQAILLRVRGTEIISYSDEELMVLPDSLFLVWPLPREEESPSQLDPTMARANEQELLRLQLGSNKAQSSESLTVFRQSADNFRIVLETTTPDGRNVIVHQKINTGEDRLIPRYALPTMRKPCFELAVFWRNEETLYRFKSLDDAFAFQTALTGYNVSHDQSNITCQFHKDAAALDCRARVQLWQEPITLPALPDSMSAGSPVGSSSTHSPHSRQSSFVESIGPSTTISRVGDGWEADNIKSSAVVMFTQLVDKRKRQRFAIMYVELTASIHIDPRRCNCHHDYDNCLYLSLSRSDDKLFPVRVLRTDPDLQGTPDPNTFDLLPFRLQRGAQTPQIVVKQTNYVLLQFPTLAEKREFHQELLLRFKVRSKQLADQREMMKGFRHRENRPVRTLTSGTGSFLPRRSVTSTETFSQTSNSPPQIELNLGNGFDVSWSGDGREASSAAQLGRERNHAAAGSALEQELTIRPAGPAQRSNNMPVTRNRQPVGGESGEMTRSSVSYSRVNTSSSFQSSKTSIRSKLKGLLP